jgi:hypothetical protein
VASVTLKKIVGTVDDERVSDRRNTQRIGQTWVVVGLLVLSAMLTYLAGGTKTPIPHAFYIPIVVAAGGFGMRAGVVTAGVPACCVDRGCRSMSKTDSLKQLRVGLFASLSF